MTDSRPLVLIADDDLEILRVLRKHLSQHYRVIEAHNGEEALELAMNQLPQCVVLDVMMPEVTGWEVARTLRKHPEFNSVGILMLTAIGERANEMTSPLYGADHQLDKPFRVDEVVEAVGRIIASKAAST